jgi:hypothetical protein
MRTATVDQARRAGPQEGLVRRYLQEVLGQRRIEVTAEIFSDDVLDHGPDGDSRGVRALSLRVHELLRVLPSPALAIHGVVVEPPMATAWFSWHCTRRTRVPWSARSITIGSVNVFRAEAERLVERWEFFDLRAARHLIRWGEGAARWPLFGSGGRPLVPIRW